VESPLTDLFTKDAIFFGEVVDTDLLMLIELGSEAGKKEQNGLRNAGMGRCYHLAWSRLCRVFNAFEFLHLTGSAPPHRV
jgi:hypothetical protein